MELAREEALMAPEPYPPLPYIQNLEPLLQGLHFFTPPGGSMRYWQVPSGLTGGVAKYDCREYGVAV